MTNHSVPMPQPKVMPARVYNTLKLTALIILPAVGTLYFALAQVWGWPEAITGTVVAINAFVGVVVKVAQMIYDASGSRFDGSLMLEENDEGTSIRLQQVDPKALMEKNEIVFQVNR